MILGVLTKVTQHVWVQNLRQKSRVLFSKYLLLTNTTISVGFSGAGDLLQQRYEKHVNRRQRWDWKRTKNISCSGLAIGPLCHFWYNFLDRVLPGKALRVVLKKVVADQIIISPICVFTFLFVVGYSEGASKAQIKDELKDKGPSLLKAEVVVWPPLQMFNFLVLPTRFRVLYDSVVSLGFDVYYSYVKYSNKQAKITDGGDTDRTKITLN